MASDKIIEYREELSKREREFLRVYRPSEQQEPIHRSNAVEIIVRGGKRAGKSVSVSAEFASRVTGMPIIAKDGSVIESRWPKPSADYPRIFWVIGWDTKHIGQTIYRLLFTPGQGGSYRVIEDEKTGLWRTYNRADPADAARIKESRLSEPLIPMRMLDGGPENAFSWEEKKGNQFSSVRLTNGATIYAFPSSARNPKQGDAVSGIWIDEDIQYPDHLKEWQDRLTDENGFFMWSAFPHMKNEALLELLHRAEMAEMEEAPRIQSFQLIMTENPFLTEQGKLDSIGRMGSDEEIQRRNRGELLQESRAMYQFSPSIHQIQRPIQGHVRVYDYPPAHLLLQKIWLETNGFPRDWTRYLAIDPSNTRTAVLSFVVPPKEHLGVYLGNVAIVEWELIARRVNAPTLAQMLVDKIGTRNYEAFIMDQQAGRQTHAGRDDNTFQVYSSAFRDKKLMSRQTSYSFLPGCNIKTVRHLAVREMMLQQPDNGLAGLLIVEETCPETKREFLRYMKKSENRGDSTDLLLDEPMNPRLYDCMACHDEETDVLTSDGWKRFSCLNGSEKLATVNKATDTLEFQYPTQFYRSHYEGDMIAFGGMKNDAMVTPNHRMLRFDRNCGDTEFVEPEVVSAGDLSKWSNIKVACRNWSGVATKAVMLPASGGSLEKEIDAKDFAAFLGWYVSEGCLQKVPKCPGVGYRVAISQSKPDGVAKLEELLSRLPWKWYKNGVNFTLHNKQLWTAVRECGIGFANKMVPQWIKSADVSVIRSFVDAAMAGDGHIQNGRASYYTSSKRLADDMQELFLRLGRGASVIPRGPSCGSIGGRSVVNTCQHYVVTERLRTIAALASRVGVPNFRDVRYSGNVYCASVPNETLVTRRNGRVLFSGNSLEYGCAHLEPMFILGQAYVNPSVYKGTGSQAYTRARKILDRQQSDAEGVVWLGQGDYTSETGKSSVLF